MEIKFFPTKIEAYDMETKDLVFKVEMAHGSAEVIVSVPVNASCWLEISAKIGEALKSMELEGDSEAKG